MKNTLLTAFLMFSFATLALSQDIPSIPSPEESRQQRQLKKSAEDVMERAAKKLKEAGSDVAKQNENLTYENFQRLELGMTYGQVKEILGLKGELTSGSKYHNSPVKTYRWKSPGDLIIKVSFRDGILIGKSQSKLTNDDGTAELNKDKFRLIQIGMSYEVISGILGSEGEMTRITTIGDDTLKDYTWKGSSSERLFVTFNNNKLINFKQEGLKDINAPKLSIEKFAQIKLGMSYAEVVIIIGSQGSETSSSKIGDDQRKAYQWKGDKFSSIRTSFRNDRLTSKSQSNVGDPNGTADITQEEFNLLDIGMSYEQVKAALGSEGEMTRISVVGETKLTGYCWKGPKYQRIYTNFKDDKLQNKSQSGLN